LTHPIIGRILWGSDRLTERPKTPHHDLEALLAMTDDETMPPAPEQEKRKPRPGKKTAGGIGGPTPGSAKMKPGGTPGGTLRDPRTGKLKALSVTHDQAYQEFIGLGTYGTIEKLHRRLEERGIQCGRSTLSSWSAKHNWHKRRAVAIKGAQDPLNVSEQLSRLGQLSSSLHVDTMDGLIAKNITALNVAMETVSIVTPTDITVMIKNLEHLVKVKGAYRAAIAQSAMVVEKKRQEKQALGEDEPVAPEPRDTPASDVPTIGSFRSKVVEGGKGGGKKP